MESSPLLPKMPAPANIWVAYNLNRYLVGVGLLLGVVVLWTASNFITAGLETGDDAYNKPFLITYFNTASFTVYLIPTMWRRYRNRNVLQEDTHPTPSAGYLSLPASPSLRRSISLPRSGAFPRSRSASPSARLIPLPDSLNPAHPSFDQDRPPLPSEEGVTVHVLPKLTVRETAEIAAWWSVVWFVANWAVNASLAWTSVASVTILSSTTGFFTLALGRICGVESLTTTKLFAVLASFLGVILVTHSDSTISPSSDPSFPLPIDKPTHPIFGDVLALTSAAFYAIYVILLKVRVVDEERADMQLMLGFAGLFNTIFLIPIFPILHYTSIEPFQLPPSPSAWLICLINFFITLSSDYLYVLAMLKTTPTLVTVGLSLTIPLALVGEVVLPVAGMGVTGWSVAGAGMVCCGFAGLGWQEYVKNAEGEGGVVVVAEDGDDGERV
ncbi:hypothetical protein I350_05088 [Cryptococcus amylolentus CBS 6273]|uniref:EamA domain-containing protein n=1 Tax=Cryptococcus amylolentus CBS 6273 TaxID=1296118 RepID=A0A1E3JUH5_9TREE|nr:hypothetical protein I350_05088 [Cryptococcus amylolentus CBS 6273]